jgi:DegV family protein with EDD domain
MSIALVTDSTAGLSPQFAQLHGIEVVPLYIRIGDETYRDGVDIMPDVFYERLPTLAHLPTTSQPSVGDFATVYRRVIERGASAILSIHLSSGLSGTVNSARLAAEQVDGTPVEIIDMASASAAHQIAVERAAEVLAEGADLASAAHAARAVADGQKTLFTVDTLEYLYKGGRIGGASALAGSILQIRPILFFRDGHIAALERVRKSARALQRMVDIMVDWLPAGEPVRAVLMEAACRERAEQLRGLLASRLQIAQTEVVPLSPVIGAHVGTGTLGICCCPMALLT